MGDLLRQARADRKRAVDNLVAAQKTFIERARFFADSGSAVDYVGDVVAEINIAGEAAANALKNAQFLVKAVNAHDDFVMDQMVRNE